MRYLVLSDIHANLEALDAVLAAAGAVDATLILGDIVGYGADPNAVIDRVRALPDTTLIRGNHDKVAAGLDSADGFNPVARYAIEWTARSLSPDRKAWLAALPAGPALIDDLVEICHGAPQDEDLYLFDESDVVRAIDASERRLCLFGHTHVPAVFRLDEELEAIGPPRGERFERMLEPQARYLVNCGAVGQPRDGDGRAAYGVVDTSVRTFAILRVDYDVAAAQAKIVEAGLPELLAHRLGMGR